MRARFFMLAAVAFLCTGCFTTRWVAVSNSGPVVGSSVGYASTVGYTYNQVPQTSTIVKASNYDISLQLDLSAVAAAFAQSATVSEFENRINNSREAISNLDLDNDGYVDYLRVLETLDRNNHIFLIQAVLGNNYFQDVATLVVETPAYPTYHVEIIGAPYIYGPNYVVRPYYHTRPYIFGYLCRAGYRPYSSPYYWRHYPGWYRYCRPVYYDRYCSCVRDYLYAHRYCRTVSYPTSCHYPSYSSVIRTYQRNDYGTKYPDKTYTTRTANTPNGITAQQRAEQARREAQRTSTSTSTNPTKRVGASTSRSTSTATSSTTGSSSSVRRTTTTSSTGSTSAARTTGTSTSGSSTRRGGSSGVSRSSGSTGGTRSSASTSTRSTSSISTSSTSSTRNTSSSSSTRGTSGSSSRSTSSSRGTSSRR